MTAPTKTPADARAELDLFTTDDNRGLINAFCAAWDHQLSFSTEDGKPIQHTSYYLLDWITDQHAELTQLANKLVNTAPWAQ